MRKKTLEEITKETLRLYDQDVDISEIAIRTGNPEYLIQSILIQARNICFR